MKQDAIANNQKKTGNATQPLVERHLEDIVCPMDIYNPHPSSDMCINTETGTSDREVMMNLQG